MVAYVASAEDGEFAVGDDGFVVHPLVGGVDACEHVKHAGDHAVAE